MTPTILAAYLKRTGIPNNAILTGRDLQLMHHNCIYENLDLSPRNFNIWQSVVYLFSFLIKAAETVPVLYQTVQQIDLNDVTAVIKAIDEFYIVLPDPEIYSRGAIFLTVPIEKLYFGQNHAFLHWYSQEISSTEIILYLYYIFGCVLSRSTRICKIFHKKV